MPLSIVEISEAFHAVKFHCKKNGEKNLFTSLTNLTKFKMYPFNHCTFPVLIIQLILKIIIPIKKRIILQVSFHF